MIHNSDPSHGRFDDHISIPTPEAIGQPAVDPYDRLRASSDFLLKVRDAGYVKYAGQDGKLVVISSTHPLGVNERGYDGYQLNVITPTMRAILLKYPGSSPIDTDDIITAQVTYNRSSTYFPSPQDLHPADTTTVAYIADAVEVGRTKWLEQSRQEAVRPVDAYPDEPASKQQHKIVPAIVKSLFRK